METQWLTLEEFSKIARLHLDTARRYAREGRIDARRIGKRYLVKAEDVEAFMEGAPAVHPKPPAVETRRPAPRRKVSPRARRRA